MKKLPSNFTVLITTNQIIKNGLKLEAIKSDLSSAISNSPSNAQVNFKYDNLNFKLDNFPTSQFLTSFPRGVYTSARTVTPGRVFDLENHILRMYEGINSMNLKPDNFGGFKELKSLRHTILEISKLGLQIYKTFVQENIEQRLKLSYYLTLDANNLPLLAFHCDNLIIPTAESCEIEAQVGARVNPNTKDSKWVLDRQIMENTKRKTCNEVILLQKETGRLYEGLSSNFFVLVEDENAQLEIWCPPREDVLIGTIMRLVENLVNESRNLKWVYKHPNINDTSRWRGAFITSTSRLLYPVHTFYLNNENNDKIEFKEIHPELLELKAKVNEFVLENSFNLEDSE